MAKRERERSKVISCEAADAEVQKSLVLLLFKRCLSRGAYYRGGRREGRRGSRRLLLTERSIDTRVSLVTGYVGVVHGVLFRSKRDPVNVEEAMFSLRGLEINSMQICVLNACW